MPRRHVIHLLAVIAPFVAFGPAPGWSGGPTDRPLAVTVGDFAYVDTSAEPTDQAAIHGERLQAFMTALRRDVEADSRFHLVACAEPCEGPAALKTGASILVLGGIHKISTLVQTARVTGIEMASNRVIYNKLYTFRGDNEEAWKRAEAFVSEDVRGALAGSLPQVATATPAPTRLALFNFELEDTSAGAEAAAQTASDATGLTDTTEAVRKLLAQSGRYSLVDVGSASADAAKAHALHDCGGCDAPIALGLGADQSLVGVVRRVSRTEYTVRFQVRDARTGAIVAEADSGLRMGANYSWSRGAARLVSDRLLESPASR
jgi:uncharacterized protein DUF2380